MYDCGDLFALSYSSTTTTGTTATGFLPYYDQEITTHSPPIYPITPPSPLLIPTSNYNEYLDSSVHEITTLAAALKSEVGYSTSTASCSSYGSPSSLPSYNYNLLDHDHLRPTSCLVQRSMSSHSLQKDGYYHPIFSSLEESSGEILDLDQSGTPMRKVYSTGDLQTSESPLSQENCTIDGMNKVGRYSAEERKERIERYRSKRNQRNFTKKIKYACRKTLADSRPRIRGRFARNEEMGESNNSQTQWNLQMENDEEVDYIWNHFHEAFNLIPN